MRSERFEEKSDANYLTVSRIRRQIFVPSNIGTNTFVFDTTSFLSLLTLVVFIVRVFSRVIQSNTVQRLTIGADPSLSRAFEVGEDRFNEVRENRLESAMKSDKFITRLKRSRRSSDRRSAEQVNNKSINSLFGAGDTAKPVINTDTIDGFESVLTHLDKNNFESQFREHQSAKNWDEAAVEKSQMRPLDRRKRDNSASRPRQFIQRPLRPIVQQQGGIAGVDYDTIYLAIGVAATALFIIETNCCFE